MTLGSHKASKCHFYFRVIGGKIGDFAVRGGIGEPMQ